jgi:hypothetical protein
MRIVQVCYAHLPTAKAGNGGQLRFWQNFASLVALGHEVHLIIFTDAGRPLSMLDPEVAAQAHSVHHVLYNTAAASTREAWRLFVSKRAALNYFFKETRHKQAEIQRIIDQIQPDLVWAGGMDSMVLLSGTTPIVLSHQDFHYKLLPLRDKLKGRQIRRIDQLRRVRLQTAELDLLKCAVVIQCVSASERDQVAQLVDVPVYYIPIVGQTIPRPTQRRASARINLFGNINNTALRISMLHFRDDVLPLMSETVQQRLEWHQVGPLNNDDEISQWIGRFFTCHGFVSDLSEQFQIGDACFSPYSEDTGFRTKFVTAAGYGLVNIGYRETFLCAPEFTPGVDCLAADSPQEMVELLSRFSQDAAWRYQLGEAARALYEREFSFEAQLPQFARILEDTQTNGRKST